MSVEVHASGNSFLLVDGVDAAFPDPAVLEAGNGLLCALEHGGMVFTGIDMGPVLVSVEPLSHEPLLDPDGWEEIVDVSVHAPHGALGVVSNLIPEPLALPLLTAHGPGVYRVRCGASGRTRALKAVVDHPVESYLLQAWPAEPVPAVVHRLLVDRLRC